MALRYAGFKVRTECKHCGHPLPLHGLSTQVPCGFCLNNVTLPEKVLAGVLECFEDKALHLAKGATQRTTLITGGFTLAVEYRKQMPRCEKCEAKFPVADIALGTDSDISCVQCGDRASTSPVPRWLRRHVSSARQYYSSEPQTPTEVVATGHNDPTPVVMTCPQCAGTLRVTEASERIMRCEYCTSDVFLPDAIWRCLHPVKVLQEWFIRFDGPTQKQREQDRERQQQRDHEAANQRAAQLEQNRFQKRTLQAIKLKPRAWFAALAMWAGLCTLLRWQLSVATSLDTILPMSIINAIASAGTLAIVLALALALALVTSIWWTSAPIHKTSGYDSDWQIFVTWFWVPFTVGFPVIGAVIGLVRAVILWRGKFSSATITTNNTSTRSYEALEFKHGEGRPAALLFLALALPGQLCFILLIAPHHAVPILIAYAPWLF